MKSCLSVPYHVVIIYAFMLKRGTQNDLQYGYTLMSNGFPLNFNDSSLRSDRAQFAFFDRNCQERARKLLSFLFIMSTEPSEQPVMDISDFDKIFNYLEQDQLKNGFRFVSDPVYHDFMTECEQVTPKAKFQTKQENIQSNKIPALLISSIFNDAAESNEVSPTFISDHAFVTKMIPLYLPIVNMPTHWLLSMFYLGSKVLKDKFRGSRKERMRLTVSVLERMTRWVECSGGEQRRRRSRYMEIWKRLAGVSKIVLKKRGIENERLRYRRTNDGVDKCVKAMRDLGLLLHCGAEGVPKDARRAKEWYERAIEEGNETAAMFNLGCLFREGAQGVEKDARRTKEWYERAIEEGNDTNAMFNLGCLFRAGADGVPKDAGCAVQLFQRAIDEGNDTDAMCQLAMLLQHGDDGVPQDAACAVELFECAIEEGNDASAMYRLGCLLEEGEHSATKDVSRAVELYNPAIEEERNDDALHRLAEVLGSGAEGVEADIPRAMGLYERAILERRSDWAMGGLFRTLLDGVDDCASVDKAKAMETLPGAVEEKMDVDGLVGLSILYARNSVSEMGADMEASRMMMRRAVEQKQQITGIEHREMVRLWKGVRDGVDGFEQNVEFATEIAGYCMEWGIDLGE